MSLHSRLSRMTGKNLGMAKCFSRMALATPLATLLRSLKSLNIDINENKISRDEVRSYYYHRLLSTPKYFCLLICTTLILKKI
eukprot:UN09474